MPGVHFSCSCTPSYSVLHALAPNCPPLPTPTQLTSLSSLHCTHSLAAADYAGGGSRLWQDQLMSGNRRSGDGGCPTTVARLHLHAPNRAHRCHAAEHPEEKTTREYDAARSPRCPCSWRPVSRAWFRDRPLPPPPPAAQQHLLRCGFACRTGL